ncbi:MAG TPA: cbb3-type cytochrome c oxidase subunit I [Phycisphaerae bacterium]|nr:cbb3-type cytochrome c oxidase subunit I [Phycisphaerae bacterium]
MPPTNRRMIISSRWAQVAILTFLIGFTTLGYLAYSMYQDHPPIPQRVVAPDGRVVFAHDDVMAGQHLFQKYGLMQLGSIFGHGAYLGPDFTAQYLQFAGREMLAFHQEQGRSEPEAQAAVREEFKRNAYDPKTRVLSFTAAQTHAFERMVDFYRDWFGEPAKQTGLNRPHISDPDEIRRLTSFFAWAAWAASAARPGASYSYTNNWPPEPLAANEPTPDALLWSCLSLIALLGGVGIVLFAFGRYNVLGWHHAADERPGALIRFRPPEQVKLTPSQRAMPWYFLVVGGLFLLQGLLGGANAHYHVEPEGFYGLDLARWFPYNLTRTWHLQLALFFVATSFLAMGIFLAPMIAGGEPRHQDKLALALFGALVLVVVGSLLGQLLSYKDVISRDGPWFWVGAQGWEYLDLGRLWQILLIIGMVLWVVILIRGLWNRLPGEHPGNMPWLFLYSALSIPLFYAAGVAFWKDTSFSVIEFWRFWVVHLWVEDFLELFTTIMVAYIFVLLGVVRPTVATAVIYLDIILYSVGGVIGTMHHMYFNGAPAQHMALGAFFSAMEVIPLVLLTYEAWHFIRLGGIRQGQSAFTASTAEFPHKWAVMFLIAVGFWNFLGAGVFGFLINLPIVSYYEIGTALTANHGHGAMMGVYGMLAIGFLVFVARYFVPRDKGSDRAMAISFWSLNIGLAWMLFVNLVPLGIVQLHEALEKGYWHAREIEFYRGRTVQIIEWLRMPGDVLFIVGGILPVVYLGVRMLKHRHRPGEIEPGRQAELFVESAATSA